MLSFHDIMRQAAAQQKQSNAELEYIKARKQEDEKKKTKEIIEQNKKKRELPKLPEKKEPTLSNVLSSIKIPKKIDSNVNENHSKNKIDNTFVKNNFGKASLKNPEKASTSNDFYKKKPGVHKNPIKKDDASKTSGKPAFSRVNDDLMDLLSSAKHVSKPINQPTQQKKLEAKASLAKTTLDVKKTHINSLSSSKSTTVSSAKNRNGVDISNAKKRLNDYTAAKPPPVKRAPPPTSFEEMMKLASENAKKDVIEAQKSSMNKLNSEHQNRVVASTMKKPLDSSIKSMQSSSKMKETTKMNGSLKSSSLSKNRMSSSSTDKYKSKPIEKSSNTKNLSDKYITKPIEKSKMSSNSEKPKLSVLAKNNDKSRSLSSTDKSRSSLSSKYPPNSKTLSTNQRSKYVAASSKSVTKDSSNIKYSSAGRDSRAQPLARSSIPSYSRPIISSYSDSYKSNSFQRKPKRHYEEDDYYDDEDDSMDDFIDDDIDEGYNSRLELSKVLKKFCRSDKDTWQRREREIDISNMHADYRTIEAEDKRSIRIARMEDLLEEQRGAQRLA